MRDILLNQKSKANESIEAYQSIADKVEGLSKTQDFIKKAIDSIGKNDDLVKDTLTEQSEYLEKTIKSINDENGDKKTAYLKAKKTIASIDSDLKFDDLRIDTKINEVYLAVREILVSNEKWDYIEADDLPKAVREFPIIESKTIFESYRVKLGESDKVASVMMTAVDNEKNMHISILNLNREILIRYSIDNSSIVKMQILNATIRGKSKGTDVISNNDIHVNANNDAFIDSLSYQMNK